ncbi:DJ-1/PfpI family protein [Pluteus cervinus]|uniref:DJ-1/PfpI family protein n=1 Tax=Pluteus cervinus TaxID=181527 RepID=A0ACD3B9G6_9AGAR|nr:DJ-1/PfpI family protein [Pluteus cervinus]
MTTNDPPPTHFGVLLFPGFQALDVFGPLDALNILSNTNPTHTLSILSSTLSPVSTKTHLPGASSSFHQSIVPTHTFSSPPDSLEVLLIPGGHGTRSPLLEEIQFVKDIYPKLRYLITVCTGSLLLAKTGVLDGKKATTNKFSFTRIASEQPQVNWVPHARWVVDGNIWTSSGVAAGVDCTLAFIEHVYGEEVGKRIAETMEFTRHTDRDKDPFAELYNL